MDSCASSESVGVAADSDCVVTILQNCKLYERETNTILQRNQLKYFMCRDGGILATDKIASEYKK